jgi:hypothetical protein
MPDVTTLFVAMAGREPDGRDAEYLAWHALDHRPEIHRLATLRGAQRLVSTPACRAARAASEDRYDGVDHVMTYLFADPGAVSELGGLATTLAEAGRMSWRLPSVEVGTYDLAGTAAAGRIDVSAAVLPWRPVTGVYLLVERGEASAGALTDVLGVAGAWWGRTGGRQITYCYLDDDPLATAEALRPVLAQRWAAGEVVPLLAAPFLVPVDFDWGRHLP